MGNKGNQIIREQQYIAGRMTTQNHLGHALLTAPTKIQPVVDQLFMSKNYYSNNPIHTILSDIPHGIVNIDGTSWTWEKMSNFTRPAVVVEKVESTGSGQYGTQIDIVLDVDWFDVSDVLVPGRADKKFQYRIQSPPVKYGDGFKYSIELMGKNNLTLPVEHLNRGAEWVKLYSKNSEGSHIKGSTILQTPIKFTSTMSSYNKSYRITDYASTEVLCIGVPDSTGMVHNLWNRFAEIEYYRQWYQELERGAWLSRSTDTVIGENGSYVRSGPGIDELMEDSPTLDLPILTAHSIEEFLMDIFYGRIKPGKGRKVKGFCGEYGMFLFHKAIEKTIGSGFIRNVHMSNPDFFKKEQSELNVNSLGYGYQFVKYYMANGCELELVHLPIRDDREINLEVSPITGYPLSSQKINIIDFEGESGTTPNIQIVNKNNSNIFTYVCGTVTPYGPNQGNDYPAHTGRYYEMVIAKDFGVQIGDTKRCGVINIH